MIALVLWTLTQPAAADPGELQGVDDAGDEAATPRFGNLDRVVGTHGIVNGQETDGHEYVVALAVDSSGFLSVYCSGTLIHPEWVITAAHCVDEAATSAFYGGNPVVAFGPDIAGGRIDKVVGQESWQYIPSWEPVAIENDIGLIHLAEPVKDVEIMVINDEIPDDTWIGVEMNFVGFGLTTDNANDTGTKRETWIPITSVNEMFIESFDAGTNICNGDSGGAALEETPQGLELAGINSWGLGGCVGGSNGVTNVAMYLDWVLEIVPDVRLDHKEPEGEGGSGLDLEVPGGLHGLGPRWADANPLEAGPGCDHTGSGPIGLLALLPALALRRRRTR